MITREFKVNSLSMFDGKVSVNIGPEQTLNNATTLQHEGVVLTLSAEEAKNLTVGLVVRLTVEEI